MTIRFFACAATMAMLASTLIASRAQAGEMDLALERLVDGGNAACQQAQIQLANGEIPSLSVDNRAWAQVMAELGAATMPSLLQPVTTSGPEGVDVMYAQTLTGISSGADYWRRGSRGSGPGSQRGCTGENRSVRSLLSRSQLRLIKSLPHGISVGSTLSKVLHTGLWTVGGELKLALVEGYRRIAVPDIAFRVAANTVVGDSQYTLTNLAGSVLVSKPFVVANIMRLTPYVAYQTAVSFASSALINLTPSVDAFSLCDSAPGTTTGTLSCSGNGKDLANDQPFKNLTLVRHQLAIGMVARYQFVQVTAEFLLDLVPIAQSASDVHKVGRQWSFGISPGVSF